MATVQPAQSMVAGDTQAGYANVLGYNGQGLTEEQLWRYPAGGSAPAQLAS